MDAQAELFEQHRRALTAVAYRMLGVLAEAEDAVQDTWLRLARTDLAGIDNVAGWLRTVVSRVCLDMLRARKTRPEQLGSVPEQAADDDEPEAEAVLVDEVGRALLVVLDTLGPAERVAFVLHDLFAVPFAEIAPIVDRSPVTTKKLASRARQRVHATTALPHTELAEHRAVVEAFLKASRDGDLAGLLKVLAPDVVRTADAAIPVAPEARGARTVAEETMVLGRRSRYGAVALVNGRAGIVIAPHGVLALALEITVDSGRISAYHVHTAAGDLTVALLPGALLPGGAADDRV